MPSFLSFLLRVFLLAAGLLFTASLAVGLLLVAAVWGVRSTWARLTGRPVMPFMMRIDPRAGFDRMYRRPPPGATPRADSVVDWRRETGDVTDVEPRAPGR